MSKYIIELGEDANMVQVISVTQSGNAYIDSTVYVGHLEQLTADYINEHFGDLQDTAYKKGFEDGKAVNDKECEGCLYNDGTKEHSPCDICCNAYLNRWTAKPTDEEIKVGDEVRDDDGDTYIITCLNDDGTFDALYPDGTAFSRADMSIIYEKTGRHFDIKGILEAMKHD